jgi:hypothetical protein
VPTDSQPDVTPAWRRALDNPWLMLAMLFLVTAALGIPFLWMSRGFTTFWKVVVTIAVLLWTALILWLFWLVMAWTVPTIWNGVQELVGQTFLSAA